MSWITMPQCEKNGTFYELIIPKNDLQDIFLREECKLQNKSDSPSPFV